LQAEETEKGVEGETHNIEIDGYDPVSKKFTFQGKTMTWDGKWFIAGKPYPLKADFTLASDSMSGVEEAKISTDGGKTWVPFFSAKWAKAAVKK
jgi:hypothetical protein